MNKTQDLKLQIATDLERERVCFLAMGSERESWVFGQGWEREGRVFGLRELGFGQGLERERERVGI